MAQSPPKSFWYVYFVPSSKVTMLPDLPDVLPDDVEPVGVEAPGLEEPPEVLVGEPFLPRVTPKPIPTATTIIKRAMAMIMNQFLFFLFCLA